MTSSSSVTDSDPTDDEYTDDQDWTDPDTCIALFMRIKEDKGFRVNFDTQRALKRLDEKHFLGKVKASKKKQKLKWNADIKAKLRRAEQQLVMHFFTGKSFYQFVNDAGLEVVFLTTFFSLSITSYSRTCKESRPEAGTEMILGTPLTT